MEINETRPGRPDASKEGEVWRDPISWVEPSDQTIDRFRTFVNEPLKAAAEEHVGAKTLSHRLKDDRFPLQVIMRGLTILRVLLGLGHAEVSHLLPVDIGHHLGGWEAALVSRDVKSDNIGLSIVSSLADIIGEADPGISRQGGISRKYALSGICNVC